MTKMLNDYELSLDYKWTSFDNEINFVTDGSAGKMKPEYHTAAITLKKFF